MLRLGVPCVKGHSISTSAFTPKPDIRVTGLLFRNVPEAEMPVAYSPGSAIRWRKHRLSSMAEPRRVGRVDGERQTRSAAVRYADYRLFRRYNPWPSNAVSRISALVTTNTQFSSSQLYTTKPIDAVLCPMKSHLDTLCEVWFRHCV